MRVVSSRVREGWVRVRALLMVEESWRERKKEEKGKGIRGQGEGRMVVGLCFCLPMMNGSWGREKGLKSRLWNLWVRSLGLLQKARLCLMRSVRREWHRRRL